MKRRMLLIFVLLISYIPLFSQDSRAHESAERTNEELKETEKELLNEEYFQRWNLVDMGPCPSVLFYRDQCLVCSCPTDENHNINTDADLLHVLIVADEERCGTSVEMGVLYNQMLDEVVQDIKTFFTEAGQPKVKHDRHIGSFGLQDVKKLANRCPQILTALHGLDPFDKSDSQMLVLTSFLMTRGSNTNKDGRQMLDLLNILMACLDQMDMEWAADSPEGINARSLYTGSLGDLNTNLWACSWKMRLSATTKSGVDLFADLPVFDEYIGTLEVGDNEVEESYIGG